VILVEPTGATPPPQVAAWRGPIAYLRLWVSGQEESQDFSCSDSQTRGFLSRRARTLYFFAPVDYNVVPRSLQGLEFRRRRCSYLEFRAETGSCNEYNEAGGGPAGAIAMATPDAERALRELGLSEAEVATLLAGKPTMFELAGAPPGTIGIARLFAGQRLQSGILTIENVGGGLSDFIRLEAHSQAAARALGVRELELMGIEVRNDRLRRALEQGGFTPTAIEAPEEVGGGYGNALSRVELIDAD
jgi:hypothetical protein